MKIQFFQIFSLLHHCFYNVREDLAVHHKSLTDLSDIVNIRSETSLYPFVSLMFSNAIAALGKCLVSNNSSWESHYYF